MKAVIIGATGATGKELTAQLLADSSFNEVHIFVRRPFENKNEKLKIHIINFEQPEVWKDLILGDVAFSCLGTTLKDAGSKEAQKKIDFDYQYRFAKNAKENGIENFVLVSAYMANSKSKIFYSKIKGELEEEIIKLNFKKLSIFKPGLLDRQKSSRQSEISAVKAMRFLNKLGLFRKQKPLPTPILAKAMIEAAKRKEQGIIKIELDQILKLSETQQQALQFNKK